MLRTVAKGGTALAAILFASQYLGPRRGDGPIASPPPLPYLSGAVVSAELPLPMDGTAGRVAAALDAFTKRVAAQSDPRALEAAFQSYFAYQERNPGAVRKPYLYFVDFGLPSTRPRAYVFDMKALRIVEGPFTVAHGSGSGSTPSGVPIRFSNVPRSKATSLGLYLAQETYTFSGRSGGRAYTSVGLRMRGLSRGFNDNARARGVVAHGAPYVTAARAGRSEGCPAMEQARARRLLPRLANGGMVFHFAPDARWLAGDPWLGQATLASAD